MGKPAFATEALSQTDDVETMVAVSTHLPDAAQSCASRRDGCRRNARKMKQAYQLEITRNSDDEEL
jgi:hypothetical protein